MKFLKRLMQHCPLLHMNDYNSADMFMVVEQLHITLILFLCLVSLDVNYTLLQIKGPIF